MWCCFCLLDDVSLLCTANACPPFQIRVMTSRSQVLGRGRGGSSLRQKRTKKRDPNKGRSTTAACPRACLSIRVVDQEACPFLAVPDAAPLMPRFLKPRCVVIIWIKFKISETMSRSDYRRPSRRDKEDILGSCNLGSPRAVPLGGGEERMDDLDEVTYIPP